MGIFRKKSEQYPCIIIDHLRNYKKAILKRDGEFLVDAVKGKQYAIVEPPVWLQEKNTRVQGFLVDEQKGCTVRLERSSDFLLIRTDPQLLGTVIGSRLVREAFDIRTSLSTLIIVAIGSAALGFFMGLML